MAAPTSDADTDVSVARRLDRNKVAIVDDEPDVLESTALLVESLGYEVIRVDDPTQILEVVERERPGLLLQDLRMPDLNVAGLVASLRSNPETADVPIVFFSAGVDLPGTAARYDAWGYLPKPFGRAEMVHLLDRVLGPADREGEVWKGRDLRREVRSTFHDYWNLLSALTNYIDVLDRTEGLSGEARRAVQGLDESILKLESKTDRLRAFLMSIIESLEPVENERRQR